MKYNIENNYYYYYFVYSLALLLSLQLASSDSYSSPITFVRQEIIDIVNIDGWNHITEEFSSEQFQDIKSITYYSDGNFLYATIFLKSLFEIHPKSNYTAYGMLIDVDYDINTGWNGFDYILTISYNNDQKIWTYQLEERSNDGSARILDQKNNFTKFFDASNSEYVYLSLDLKKINYPEEFLIVFYTDYDYQDNESGSYNAITDFSDMVFIPPPRFQITTLPNNIILRPGEEDIVQININTSNRIIKPEISFFTENKSDILNSFVRPNKIEIPYSGFAATYLYINILNNASPQLYSLPIYVKVEFPTQTLSKDLKKEITKNTTIYHNLRINILEPFSFEEKFTNFWNVYGGVLSLIGGGFIAGISGILIEKLRKKTTNN
jgi:hypothetical protein